MTLFAMVFGQCPITATSTAEMYDRICNSTSASALPRCRRRSLYRICRLTLPWPIHPRQEHLIRRMLDKNPDTRITLDEIKVTGDPFTWVFSSNLTANILEGSMADRRRRNGR